MDFLSRVTSTSEEDGGKCSIRQSCSGKGGHLNIYLQCKKDENGLIQEETSLKEILSSLLMLQIGRVLSTKPDSAPSASKPRPACWKDL